MQPTAKKSKSGKPSGTSGSSKTGATTSSSQPGKSSGSSSNKNSKESFQKKLLICQKNFDYKDESRDVKGKTERLNAINEI